MKIALTAKRRRRLPSGCRKTARRKGGIGKSMTEETIGEESGSRKSSFRDTAAAPAPFRAAGNNVERQVKRREPSLKGSSTMKKMLAVLMTLAMILSLAACGGSSSSTSGGSSAAGNAGGSSSQMAEDPKTDEPAGDVVTISLAHIRPEGSSADLAIREFCKEVGELTGGTVAFEIYPASQLGDYTTVFEAVMIGDVDMQFATVPTSVDKFFGISNGAYLAATWEEAKEMFATGGAIMNEVKKKMDDIGVTYLCMYPLYFGGIALGVEPVDPTNPDAKSGIKIRVPSMTSFEKTAEELGYLGTPLPSSETFTSMQTGVVDGAIGMGAEGYYSNLADLVKYFLPINDHFECWNLIINSDKFNSLTPEQQEAFKTAAQHLEEKRWEVAEAETDEYIQKLKDNGTVVIEYTDEELEAFSAKIREKVWPLIREDFGGELFDQVTAGK